MNRAILMALSLFSLLYVTGCKPGYEYPFQNPDLSREERVDDLVSRMTLEEKIAQMLNNAPAIERLGIPAYNWWNEGLHGVARTPYRVTMFPQAIGMAATFDKEAIHQVGVYTSDEGRAIYHDRARKGNPSIFCGLTYWSPNINIFRDPRWGRGQETYGEDPYLTGQMGMSFVNGIQGDDPDYLKAAACAKHYAVHSGPEWNRHTFNAVVSQQDLWDTYLPAFQDLVVDAKVAGVMGAYNALFGQPCCGSELLLVDILRGKWNFDGYVVSDCGAIDDIYRNHRTQPDQATAATNAVIRGTDCECGNSTYFALAEAVERGLITEAEIDTAVKNLFDIRFRMGMFDPDKLVPYSKIPLSVLESPEHKAHALNMAHESMVLLKNDGILPLDMDKLDKIAVVGPNAADESVLLANYYGYPSELTSALEGIRSKAEGKAEVVYEKGVNYADNLIFVSEYDESCFSHDGEPGFNAEYYQGTDKEAEFVLSRHEGRPDYRWGEGEDIAPGVKARYMSAIYTTTYTAKEDGEVCFHIHADDRADFFIDGVRQEKLPSVQSYYLLDAKAGQKYELKIFYVQNTDTGEVTFDFGKMHRSDYKEVAERVGDADVIIYVGGLSARLEGEEMPIKIDGFKGGDRTSLELPAAQREFLKELKATGRPVVFVLYAGSAIGLGWEDANLSAILSAWYGGQAGGQAVADVLVGDYNPAGRLPVTFYKDDSQLPDFEDYAMDGRTYRYFDGEPLYRFGYGLSYTSFEYSDMRIEKAADGTVKVSVNVTNTGGRDGDEVVQLYVSNPGREFRTPIRALKGFDRISLKAGKSERVEFLLTGKELSVVDLEGESVSMKGEVILSIGGCQPDAESLYDGRCVQNKLNI